MTSMQPNILFLFLILDRRGIIERPPVSAQDDITELDEDETEEDTVSQFEMENELEGFISQNWDSIFPEWEKIGRQVVAGNVGRMDFLGKHKTNEIFKVWELKRGETDDVALAQLLRYMGYITNSMGNGDKRKVNGQIICLKQGEGLKMAIGQLDGRVSVMEYQVQFSLRPAEKA